MAEFKLIKSTECLNIVENLLKVNNSNTNNATNGYHFRTSIKCQSFYLVIIV